MKVGVFSDVHENFHNLALVLQKMEELRVERIVFLGDFINNGIAKVMASSSIPIFAVWGNNDGDQITITKTSMSEGSNLEVGFSTFDIVELENRKVFLTHYPMLAKPMAKSGDFDAVFYGHNHKKKKEFIGECLVLNPGEISAHKTGEATFAVYDTVKNDAEIMVLEDAVTTKTEFSHRYLKQKTKFRFSTSRAHQY